ncbi:acyl transferase 5-like [Bidens hawaiensis]|uniref:acyl transferase 5-like n=1 Tax=Bidens hawaiensis TaxID=980011 RepID=UPI004048FA35
MELCVTKSNGKLVAPSGPTLSTMLDLSRIDRLPGLRFNAQTLHVFEPIGPHGAAWPIIREALSNALVLYYPLAGRLSPDGSCIDCTSDGVWFVEATATCTLHSVGYFKDVAMISFDDLLPSHPLENQGINPFVLMQITEFDEGGFVMGLIFSHTICDGLGAAQFLTAVSECARGVDPLTVTPSWHRNFIPPSSTTIPPPHFTPPDYHLEQATIDIPLDQITQLKHKLMEESLQQCSTFELIAAILWMNRTRAIKSGSESKTKTMRLVFFADCPSLVSPPLPKGFYGNCFFPVTVTASNETLAQAPIIEVVRMTQGAKARLPEEFSDWIKEEIGQSTNEDPFAPQLGYETLFITDWRRLGFEQIDYGSGPAVHVVPTQGSAVIPSAIIGSVPRPDKGVRLMTWCVENHHLQPFLQSIPTILLPH